jgi:hypothetical protein
VRFEDRELAGPEAELELARENELEHKDEHELPEIEPLAVLDDKSEHRVIDAMRAILEHRSLVVNDLALPKRELDALEALKTAVDARDGKLHQFVYASDRQHLLEQALAILQPKIAEHTEKFADLIEHVGGLRHDLKGLVDAQDNLLEGHAEAEKTTDSETDDKPEDQSLDGPERVVPATPTTLTGPELRPEPEPPTTLTGPERKPEPAPATTLTGADLQPEPTPKSTLGDGPAVADAAPPPTSLGDPKELAETDAKRPWWKFGRKS